MAHTTLNFWLLLDREHGVKYGVDIRMIEQTRIVDGIVCRFRKLEFNGVLFDSARQIYETVSNQQKLCKR